MKRITGQYLVVWMEVVGGRYVGKVATNPQFKLQLTGSGWLLDTGNTRQILSFSGVLFPSYIPSALEP